jgi:hypothetical protein
MSSTSVIILIASSCCISVIVATILGLFFSHKNGSLKSGLLDNIFGKPESQNKNDIEAAPVSTAVISVR